MRGVVPMEDSRYYLKVAQAVAEGDVLGDEVFYLAPLYSYSLALPLGLSRTRAADGSFAYDIPAVRTTQSVVGAINCGLLCWIGCALFGGPAGVLAGLVATTYPVFIYYDGILMPSTLILFVHLLALLVLVYAARRRSSLWWLGAGVALAFCALSHGVGLMTFLAALLWVWLGFPGAGSRVKLSRSVLLLAGFLPLIGMVTLRNYIVGDDLVLLTSNSGRVAYIGNNPTATGTFRSYPSTIWGANLNTYLDGVERTANDMSPSEMSKHFLSLALEYVREQPGQALLLMGKKLRLFFHAVELGINDQFYFARRFSPALRWPVHLPLGLILPIGVTGLVFAVRDKLSSRLLLLFIASQVVTFTLMFVLGRYRLVMIACFILLAAAQILWWWRSVRERRYRRVLPSLVLAALLAVVVNLPIEGLDKTRGFGQQYAHVGTTYLSWGEHDRAEASFRSALESDFEPWTIHHMMRARCHMSLGEIHRARGEADDALKAYQSALAEINAEEIAPTKDRLRRRIVERIDNMRLSRPE
ncbi:glycosyltransferase family 39 protein [Candidatus Eisenbacteria bacterium]|uniref:Glycosyltransferase family 39 protein n=1 Tax=Eiseniibacteriota bacterium TaxID=2212470 RepID=A0ABV6YJ77_UNCEI